MYRRESLAAQISPNSWSQDTRRSYHRQNSAVVVSLPGRCHHPHYCCTPKTVFVKVRVNKRREARVKTSSFCFCRFSFPFDTLHAPRQHPPSTSVKIQRYDTACENEKNTPQNIQAILGLARAAIRFSLNRNRHAEETRQINLRFLPAFRATHNYVTMVSCSCVGGMVTTALHAVALVALLVYKKSPKILEPVYVGCCRQQ